MVKESYFTKMMSCVCEAVAKRLYEYLDGELNFRTRLLIRMHLGICARCSHRCQFYQALSAGIRERAEEMRPTENLRARLLSVIHSNDGSPDPR